MVNDGKKMLCGLALVRIRLSPQGEDVTAMPFSELMNQHHGMRLVANPTATAMRNLLAMANAVASSHSQAFGHKSCCAKNVRCPQSVGEVRGARLHGPRRAVLAC